MPENRDRVQATLYKYAAQAVYLKDRPSFTQFRNTVEDLPDKPARLAALETFLRHANDALKGFVGLRITVDEAYRDAGLTARVLRETTEVEPLRSALTFIDVFDRAQRVEMIEAALLHHRDPASRAELLAKHDGVTSPKELMALANRVESSTKDDALLVMILHRYIDCIDELERQQTSMVKALTVFGQSDPHETRLASVAARGAEIEELIAAAAVFLRQCGRSQIQVSMVDKISKASLLEVCSKSARYAGSNVNSSYTLNLRYDIVFSRGVSSILSGLTTGDAQLHWLHALNRHLQAETSNSRSGSILKKRAAELVSEFFKAVNSGVPVAIDLAHPGIFKELEQAVRSVDDGLPLIEMIFDKLTPADACKLLDNTRSVQAEAKTRMPQAAFARLLDAATSDASGAALVDVLRCFESPPEDLRLLRERAVKQSIDRPWSLTLERIGAVLSTRQIRGGPAVNDAVVYRELRALRRAAPNDPAVVAHLLNALPLSGITVTVDGDGIEAETKTETYVLNREELDRLRDGSAGTDPALHDRFAAAEARIEAIKPQPKKAA